MIEPDFSKFSTQNFDFYPKFRFSESLDNPTSRVFDIGDEFKYEKTQITWSGMDVTVQSDKAKAKLTVGETTARINNLRGNDRAGFLEGNVGAVNIILGVLFTSSNTWLQARDLQKRHFVAFSPLIKIDAAF